MAQIPTQFNQRKGEFVHHARLLACLDPWEFSSDLLHKCRQGIVVYAVVKVVTTVTTLVFVLANPDAYGAGELNLRHAYLYITALQTVSQVVRQPPWPANCDCCPVTLVAVCVTPCVCCCSGRCTASSGSSRRCSRS